MLVITIARKPLESTVAINVIKHGVGGINIDATRIGTEGGTRRDGLATMPNAAGWANMKGHGIATMDAGRWPANLILSQEVVGELDEQSGILHARGNVTPTKRPSSGMFWGKGHSGKSDFVDQGDPGGASRFFKVVGMPSVKIA